MNTAAIQKRAALLLFTCEPAFSGSLLRYISNTGAGTSILLTLVKTAHICCCTSRGMGAHGTCCALPAAPLHRHHWETTCWFPLPPPPSLPTYSLPQCSSAFQENHLMGLNGNQIHHRLPDHRLFSAEHFWFKAAVICTAARSSSCHRGLEPLGAWHCTQR